MPGWRTLNVLKTPRLLIASITLCACSLSRHPTVVAQTPTPSATEISFEGPGIIEWEAVISAKWEANLRGLLDLDDPKVKAAGIEDEVREIVLPVHLLTHPEHGVFAIDTGISQDLVDGGKGTIRGLLRLYLGKVEGIESLGSMLERQSAPLSAVFLTHGHIDHVLGLPDLALDTPIYTGPDDAIPLGAMKAIDVLGDASLWAIPVPGHTPGSMAFLAHTTRGPVLFVGDSSHTRWGWDNGVPPGLYSADIDQNRRSLEQLKALAGDLDLQVVVGHEWEEGDAAK
jgi:N-acyl homoserine lactone hydrolase